MGRKATGRPRKKGLQVQEYRLKSLQDVVRVGETVLLRPPNENTLPYVARIESIEIDKNDVKVKTRWYYRPEESVGGRRNFHGAKEVFLSDHFDICSADAIEGKCVVHTFKQYVKLENVGPEDYFCRFEYKAATGAFKPDHVAVYCVCEMPYNPDDLMVQCDVCKDWFHPACIHLTPEQVKKMSQFVCEKCQSEALKQQRPLPPQQQQQPPLLSPRSSNPQQQEQQQPQPQPLLVPQQQQSDMFRKDPSSNSRGVASDAEVSHGDGNASPSSSPGTVEPREPSPPPPVSNKGRGQKRARR